jgi:hypothetical protein
MSADRPRGGPTDGPDASRPAGFVAIIGGGSIVALGVGWFTLSHFVMGTATGDAMGEALGVMLALLVVASIVGAVVSARGRPG